MPPFSPYRRYFLSQLSGLTATAWLAPQSIFAEEAAASDPPPMTGEEQPDLRPFDELLTAFLAEHRVPGASLAIAHRGRLVYARGFGWGNVAEKEPVQPSSLFRIASISKPLTAVAMLRLVENKKLSLEDKVLKYLEPLPKLPPGGEFDRRWEEITIRHCLQHRGGWDRKASFDPIGRPAEIANELKIEFPVQPAAIVRYMLGRKLDFQPGERMSYSNFGYLLLGRAIERVTGESYETHLQAMLSLVGIRRMQLGRALVSERAQGEVRYYDSQDRVGPAVFPPQVGEEVPLPDGAQNIEGFEAHGGWIASAVDLLRFATAFDNPPSSPLLSAESITTMWERPPGLAGHDAEGKPLPSYYGCGWSVRPIRDSLANTWHGGLISGTSTLLVRRWDQIHWAILFNSDASRKDQKTLATHIDPLLHRTAEKIEQWPKIDLFPKCR